MQSARAVRPSSAQPAPKSAAREVLRPYVVRLVGHDLAQAVEAPSFMAAALMFAERIADRGEALVDVVATDAETGASERYTLALNAR